jgi:hypothetical protein
MAAKGASNFGAGYAFGGERALRIHDRVRVLRRIKKRNDLAERVSQHGDVPRAADEIGVSRSYGRVLWGEIKRGLGWQAS